MGLQDLGPLLKAPGAGTIMAQQLRKAVVLYTFGGPGREVHCVTLVAFRFGVTSAGFVAESNTPTQHVTRDLKKGGLESVQDLAGRA